MQITQVFRKTLKAVMVLSLLGGQLTSKPFYQYKIPEDYIINSLLNRCHYYSKADSTELADSILLLALNRAKLMKDKSSSYWHQSIVFEEFNIIDSAINYCKLGIEEYNKDKDFEKLSQSYSRMHDLIRWSLGGTSENTYILENLMDSAMSNALKSQNKYLITETLISKGLYTHNYDFDLAMEYFNRAIDSIEGDEELKSLLFGALFQRGNAFLSNHQYQLAKTDYLSCLDILDSISDFENQRIGIYTQLGIVYHRTGEFRKGIDFSNKAYLLSLKEDDPDLTGILSTLAKLYRDNGQKDSCIYVLSNYVNYLFDRFNDNSARSIAESGALFKVSEYQTRIDLLNTENLLKETQNRAQRIFIIFLVLFILLISIFSFLTFKQYIKVKTAFQTIQRKNNEIAKQKDEIKRLKEQKSEKLTNRFEQDLYLFDRLMKEDKLFLKSELTLSEVANILNINHTYLSCIINRHFGISFTYLLNQYRINEAVRLLNSGIQEKYSIEAISKMVGFKSKSAFYRAFRHHKACTPSEYLSGISG